MTSVIVDSELQQIFLNLIPFITTVGIYFGILIPYGSPSITAVILKCAPIVCLMYFVRTLGYRNNPVYSRRILLGLICCCIGDALLLWNGFFLPGMLAFLAGHINYTYAFGIAPLRPILGIMVFAAGGVLIAILYPGLNGALAIGVPAYMIGIAFMIWRASARLHTPWTWIQLCTCIGSVLFAFSDFLIGIDKFLHPIAHSQVLIMSSYFAAQLGISLSVAEPME